MPTNDFRYILAGQAAAIVQDLEEFIEALTATQEQWSPALGVQRINAAKAKMDALLARIKVGS